MAKGISGYLPNWISKENAPKAAAGVCLVSLAATAALLIQHHRVVYGPRVFAARFGALKLMAFFSALDITLGKLTAEQLSRYAIGTAALAVGSGIFSYCWED